MGVKRNLAPWVGHLPWVVVVACTACLLTASTAIADVPGADVPRPGVRQGAVTVVADRSEVAFSEVYVPASGVIAASDAAGSVTVLWATTGGVLRSRVRSPRGVWGKTVVVDCARPAIRWCSAPQLSVSASGRASATWEVGAPREDVYEMNDVAAADRSAAGIWGPPTRVTATRHSASVMAPSPHVVTGGGAALVTWTYGHEFKDVLWGAYRPPGASWDKAQRVRLGAYGWHGVSVAMSRIGSALVVQRGLVRVRARLYLPGSGWLAPTQIATTEGSVAVAMGPRGHALAAWNTGGGPRHRRIKARPMTAAGHWGAVRHLSRRARSDSDPAVAIGRDGTEYVAWVGRMPRALGGGATVNVTRHSPHARRDTETVTEDRRNSQQLAMSVGRHRTVALHWIEYPEGFEDAYDRTGPGPRAALTAALRSHSGVWSTPVVVAGTRGEGLSPDSVPLSRGFLMLWHRGQRLLARSLDLGARTP